MQFITNNDNELVINRPLFEYKCLSCRNVEWEKLSCQ